MSATRFRPGQIVYHGPSTLRRIVKWAPGVGWLVRPLLTPGPVRIASDDFLRPHGLYLGAE